MIYFLQRTIGQKWLVGLSGLGLCVFVFIHMLGNLLIFKGAAAYNMYAYNLHKIFIFELLELSIFALFFIHIFLSLFVNFKNISVRKGYKKILWSGDKATNLTDKVLIFQGFVLLFFLITHLLTFKWGPYYEVLYDGEKVRDIYTLVVTIFSTKPLYVFFYTISLIVLGIHLVHGAFASLKSLGLSHPKYLFLAKIFSWIFGIGVSFGFLSQPIYIYFFMN